MVGEEGVSLWRVWSDPCSLTLITINLLSFILYSLLTHIGVIMKTILLVGMASVAFVIAFTITILYMAGELPFMPTLCILLLDIMLTAFLIDEGFLAVDEEY